MPIQTVQQAISNESPNSSPFGFRNRIQNGEILVNQRANANTTNTASNLNGNFQIDRWKAEHYNIGGSFNPNISIKQTADHPVKGSNGYCMEIQCNTTGTTANNVDFFSMSQHIEAQNIADAFSGTNAQPMTLSFWVKSNKTGTYCVQLRDDLSLSAGYIIIFDYTITQSGVWEKKVINIPKPTYSAMPSNNSSGLGIMFHYASGLTPTYNPVMAPAVGAWFNNGTQGAATNNQTNLFTAAGNYHRLTDVQLEVGTVATPFERKPFSTELALCQRYLPAITSTSGADVYIGQNYATTAGVMSIPLPVTARVPPTGVTVTGTISNWSALSAAGGAINLTALTFNRAGNFSAGLTYTVASGLVGGNASWIIGSMVSGNAILFTGCEL